VPLPPGLFTPPPDLAHRTWYTRDVRLIAAADHRRVTSSALLEADATPNEMVLRGTLLVPYGSVPQVTCDDSHVHNRDFGELITGMAITATV